MPETEETCPPHHWMIESRWASTSGIETWTCQRCPEVRTHERRIESNEHPYRKVTPAAPSVTGERLA